MSKDFEKEYREMMNSQVPDLWDRIEQGVNASERANKVISFEDASANRKVQTEYEKPVKKRPINMYQLYALAGVVACTALVMVGMPTVKRNMLAEQQAEEAGRAAIEQQAEKETADASSKMLQTEDSTEQVFIHTKDVETEKPEKSSETASVKKKAESLSEVAEVKEQSETKSAEAKTESTIVEPVKEKESETKTSDNDKAKEGTSTALEQKKTEEKSTSMKVEKTENTSSTDVAAVVASSADVEDLMKEKISSSVETKQQNISSSAETKQQNISSSAVAEIADLAKGKETSSSAAAALENTGDANAEIESVESTESKSVAVMGQEESVVSDSQMVSEETYQGVTVKITAVSKSKKDGSITYTVKVIDDPSKTFKKNKKLKMVSENELLKNTKYMMDFVYSGETTKKKAKIYKVITATNVVEN